MFKMGEGQMCHSCSIPPSQKCGDVQIQSIGKGGRYFVLELRRRHVSDTVESISCETRHNSTGPYARSWYFPASDCKGDSSRNFINRFRRDNSFVGSGVSALVQECLKPDCLKSIDTRMLLLYSATNHIVRIGNYVSHRSQN
jgi:hypothetical protein